jgi:hypothetical protein
MTSDPDHALDDFGLLVAVALAVGAALFGVAIWRFLF